ncbi:hypothetical protein HDV01_001054 [Terramyces sp. JEL0728]|nr:hypothetical protein HDV01_001054 [Terramyces sp. JEL0728]
MFKREYIGYDNIYTKIQLTAQVIILLITGIFWVYTLVSPVFKKGSYNLKVNLLLSSCIISQALYIPYFAFPVDENLFLMICGITLFTTFVLTGYYEMDFLKIISVITTAKNETLSKLQIVWIIWSILAGYAPVIIYYISAVYSQDILVTERYGLIQKLCAVIFDVTCVAIELAIGTIVITSIHAYIKKRFGNEEENKRFSTALEKYARLKHVTVVIMCNDVLCTLLFALKLVIKDPLQQALVMPSIVAYRFLVCQNCLFPTDHTPESSAAKVMLNQNANQSANASLVRTRMIGNNQPTLWKSQDR